MTDSLFWELTYKYSWWYGSTTLHFGGKPGEVGLLVRGEEDEPITNAQKEAYLHFLEKWPILEQPMLEELVRYYNEEERFSYGPDPKEEPEEYAEWWPEINTPEAMVQAVTPDRIVVDDYMQKRGRLVYLLFDRIWGGEDWNDNGVAVAFLNEKIEEISYKNIAY